jgi:hypothetical protein
MALDKSHQYRFSHQALSKHEQNMHDPVNAMLSTLPVDWQVQYNRTSKPIYNLEPMLIERGLNENEFNRLKRSGKYIYDFDLRNVETLQVNGLKAEYRPMVLNEGLLSWVGDYGSERDIDVLFIGNLSDYRKPILQEIENLGIHVHIVKDTYGKDATDIMKRAKIVLNIHRDGAVQAQEQLRIAWAIACGCLVVSETSLKPSIPNYIIDEYDAGALPMGLFISLGKWSFADAEERKEKYIKLSKKYLKKHWGLQ